MSSNSPSGGMKLMLLSLSNLLSFTHCTERGMSAEREREREACQQRERERGMSAEREGEACQQMSAEREGEACQQRERERHVSRERGRGMSAEREREYYLVEGAVVNSNAAVGPAPLSLVELGLKALSLWCGWLGLLVNDQLVIHTKLALRHATQIALHHHPSRHMGTQSLP